MLQKLFARLVLSTMLALIPATGMLASSAHAADNCSQYCDPAKSTPCGNACISKHKTCRKSWSTACVGIRDEQVKGYKPSEVKHVNQAPGSK